jgi:hypothetical protein
LGASRPLTCQTLEYPGAVFGRLVSARLEAGFQRQMLALIGLQKMAQLK